MLLETSTPSLTDKAIAAMRAAVARVIEDHRRGGKPLAVWKAGRVVQETYAATDEVREAAGYTKQSNGPKTRMIRVQKRRGRPNEDRCRLRLIAPSP